MDKKVTKKELRENLLKEKLQNLSDREVKLYYLKKDLKEYNKQHGFKKNNGYKVNTI